MLGVIVPNDFSNHAVREHVPLGKVIELWVDPCHGAWSGMISHVADNTSIGSVGFKCHRMTRHGRDRLRYLSFLSRSGPEMDAELIRWTFEQPSVNRVTAECLPDNWASIRVLEKVGMRQVVSSADMLRWAMKREDYGH